MEEMFILSLALSLGLFVISAAIEGVSFGISTAIGIGISLVSALVIQLIAGQVSQPEGGGGGLLGGLLTLLLGVALGDIALMLSTISSFLCEFINSTFPEENSTSGSRGTTTGGSRGSTAVERILNIVNFGVGVVSVVFSGWGLWKNAKTAKTVALGDIFGLGPLLTI